MQAKSKLKVEKRVGQIYEIVKKEPTISRAEIGRRMGITDKQSRLAIEILKERGFIHREGSARKGNWVVDK